MCNSYGLIQNVLGSTGSRTLIWPEVPSQKPRRANTLKAPAICSSCHCLFLYGSLIVGMPGNSYPPVATQARPFGIFSSVGFAGAALNVTLCCSVTVVDDMATVQEALWNGWDVADTEDSKHVKK